jgi:hypothetical protein
VATATIVATVGACLLPATAHAADALPNSTVLPTVTTQDFSANLVEAPVSDYGVSVASNGTVSLPAGDTVQNVHGQAVLYKGSTAIGPMVGPNAQPAVASGPPTAPTVVPTPGSTTNGLLRRAKATKGVVNGCDCEVTWGIISGTVYFNKKGTGLIAVGGASAAAIFALVGGPLGDVLALGGIYLMTTAEIAKEEGWCLDYRFGLADLVNPEYDFGGAGHYSGGFCTGSY